MAQIPIDRPCPLAPADQPAEGAVSFCGHCMTTVLDASLGHGALALGRCIRVGAAAGMLTVGAPALAQDVPVGPEEQVKIVVLGGIKASIQRFYFDANQTKIRARDLQLVDEIARTLRDHPEIRTVEVRGHTHGEAAALGTQRAEAVRKALIAKGIDPVRLVPIDVGDAEPLSPDDPAQNRRVEFQIVD